MKNQKIGGIAALIEALLYIIGIAFLFMVLSPAMDDTSSDIEKLAFILENKTLYQVWHLLIYVVFGLVLIPLTIAIHENFTTNSAIGKKVMPILGFIWSALVISSGMISNIGLETVNGLFIEEETTAVMAWEIIGAIQNGLGGGVEVVGGLWVFLISVHGLKEHIFPRSLNYFGLLVGGAGILTAIPGLGDLGLLFGLTQILWFGWIGTAMIQNKNPSI
ncbi:hypothetical protein L0P88_14005 [Muricauda sp. SCSIO 64092]|uniref:hypothetical protein n=1 Tax=Allomuricauda sp. SCSIO 64092 TaxID=2908842 RepID=UPI001FF3579E|nr:hypothetical protein [Muricauda sp. SCSIO 64092]UOY05064.1 hypothetical protein L0P88_14005 [Muricauda sp. SCSIO 64092]